MLIRIEVPYGKDLFYTLDRYHAVPHSLKTEFLPPSCAIVPTEHCQPSEHDFRSSILYSHTNHIITCRISETNSLHGNSATSYSSIFSSSSPVSNRGLGFFDILMVVKAKTALITI
jgi:hypothetical protein